MTVKELIEQLQKLPEDDEVMLHYDGDARLICDGAYQLHNHERYNPYLGDYETVHHLVVLCQTNDVYGPIEWLFKKGK